MDLTNDFRVAIPIDRAWEVLTDLERIAPCMPGARPTISSRACPLPNGATGRAWYAGYSRRTLSRCFARRGQARQSSENFRMNPTS